MLLSWTSLAGATVRHGEKQPELLLPCRWSGLNSYFGGVPKTNRIAWSHSGHRMVTSPTKELGNGGWQELCKKTEESL